MHPISQFSSGLQVLNATKYLNKYETNVSGVAGTQELSALVAPSTSGLRSALKREDVEFSLPLFKPRQEEDEDAGVPETDSTTEFLESLGIEADSLPGLANATPKNRLQAGHGSGKNIDGRPESLLLVEGVECQSLLNYLLNAKLTLGQGVSALPPTLLAPVAFQGAVLRNLQLRQTAVTSHGITQHAMELTGPMLPSNIQSLVRLATIQNPEFSVTMQTAEETVAFSQVGRGEPEKVAPSAFASASLGDCGLSPELLASFTAPPPLGEPIVRDLTWLNSEGFTVNLNLSNPNSTNSSLNMSNKANRSNTTF